MSTEQTFRRYDDRHPITGRFLAYDCEVDCQSACWWECGAQVEEELPEGCRYE